MTRAQKFFGKLLSFLAAWLIVLNSRLSDQLSSQLYHVVLLLPLYLLIAFGCYSIGVIAYNLLIFNDCKEATQELEKDIQRARAHLTAKGFRA